MGFDIVRYNRSSPEILFCFYKRERAQEKIDKALKRKLIDERTAKIAHRVVHQGLPPNMKIAEVAALGKPGNGAIRAKTHLGKELLLEARTWDGQLNIKKWLASHSA